MASQKHVTIHVTTVRLAASPYGLLDYERVRQRGCKRVSLSGQWE